ncbi:MAG: protocatechuate 3,4-dioxygenase, beta subunit [Abditibacteriota bacterium]|nr:protocatechuate 3,4-dioxygenase, beta subunit [Abditibacteriota bacterium]
MTAFEQHHHPLTRRRFLRRMASGLVVVTGGAMLLNRMDNVAFAEALTLTPWQTQGPFYPDKLPLDTDNDLLIINKNITAAVGTVTHLSGRVLDARGEPVSGAVVEIWQVDNNGAYLHSQDYNARRDANFQGYGRFETGKTGQYRFRTVKPVPYPGRTPHIHMKVLKGERELLTTQLYVQGHPRNERDGVLRGIRDARQRASVILPFTPIPGSKISEVAARFDIVLGETPQT